MENQIQDPITPTPPPQVTLPAISPVFPKKNNLVVILLSILLVITLLISGYLFLQVQGLTKQLAQNQVQPSPTPVDNQTLDYTLEKSEGVCKNDAQCQWAGEGCGGGHGICTNNPERYKDSITTCDIVESFPSNRGFTCGCIETLGRCGWKK